VNLIKNGLEAMEEAAASSKILRLRSRYVPSGGISLFVEDSGKGIPKEALPVLGDLSFSTKAQGSGIGLGLVRGIVEAHGGEIRLHANDWGGATIEVYLPIKSPHQGIKGMARIFVVDDEEGICQILKTILEDEGYSVQTADRLYKARSLLDEETPDLLLLDIKMPDGDGLDFLESLQDGLRPPVIVISGHGQIEDAVRAIKLGAYDFLEKPIALEKLLGTVKKALRVRRRQQSRKRNLG